VPPARLYEDDLESEGNRVAEQQSSLAKKIVKGAVVVLFFWFFWKFGGFLLNIIIGSFYPPGKAPAADAYSGVYKTIIFTFIYSSSLKVLVPAFMPVFIDKMTKDGEAKAWEFAYSIFNIVLILAIVVSGIGLVAAPFIIDLLLPGFQVPEKAGLQELCVTLLRIMLPGSIGLVLSMVMMSLFNSYKIFGVPSAADAAQKLLWAVAIFLGAKLLHMDARTLAYGFLVGCVVQLVINGVGMGRKRSFYRPLISTPGPRRLAIEFAILAAFGAAFVGVVLGAQPAITALSGRISSLDSEVKIEQAIRFTIFTAGLLLTCAYSGLLTLRLRGKTSPAARFASLAAPLLIGVVFARYRDVVTFFFQSYTDSGVFASVEFAKNIGNFPIVLVAYGLSVAMFPYLCELASGKDLATFGNLVTRAIRMIALFFIPLSIAIILLDRPLIALVYDRGNWTSQHIGYTATALSLFVFALFFYAIENVIMQAFFSVQRMWAPTFMGIIASLSQVIFLAVGISVLGYSNPYDIFLAVSIAYPLTRILKEVALLAILRRHVPILPVRETAVFFAKLAAASAVFALAVHYSYRAIETVLHADNFKRGDVVVDTFNAETAGWTSRDADELEVAHADGRQALAFSYRPHVHRDVSLERELRDFRLDGVSGVSFTCKATVPQTVAVACTDAKGSQRLKDAVQVGTEWQRIDVSLNASDRVRQVSFLMPKVQGDDVRTLFISDLRFTCDGREIVTDHFAQPSPAWSAQGRTLKVSEVGEGDAEMGLLLADGPGDRSVVPDGDNDPVAVSPQSRVAVRDLHGYDLRGTVKLRFKAKSTVPGKLRIAYICTGRSSESLPYVDSQPSEKRKTYEQDLVWMESWGDRKDRPLNPLAKRAEYLANPESLERIWFEFIPDEGQEGSIWLDNVTFCAPRGFMGLNLDYEIAKFLCVAIPCALGGIVLIVLIFIIRIEEGRMVLDWMLEQGRAKLGARIRKRAPAPNEGQ